MGKLPGDAPVTLRRCRFANAGTAGSLRWGGQNVPMLLHQTHPSLLGGFELDEIEVSDELDRPFLKCDSCDGRGAATNITGAITVRNPHGCKASLGAAPHNVTLNVTCEQ